MAYGSSKSVRFHYDVEYEKNPIISGEMMKVKYKIDGKRLPESISKRGGRMDEMGGKSLKAKVLSRVFSEDYEKVKTTILDPRGPVIRRWNKMFLVACLVSLFVDPLFFYLPVVEEDVCIDIELNVEIVLTIIRSIADMFYAVQIYVQFHTAYVAPSSRVFGRGELVVDPSKIASRYFLRFFWIDVIAALPLPQVLIWFVIPNLGGSLMMNTKNVLRFIIIFQYFPRVFLVFPLSSQIVKATGVVTETAWAGAAYNLMLYMLASHVIMARPHHRSGYPLGFMSPPTNPLRGNRESPHWELERPTSRHALRIGGCTLVHWARRASLGASWYLLSIERQEACWRHACNVESSFCQYNYFDCHGVAEDVRNVWFQASNVSSICNPDNTTPYPFGIFGDAVTSQVISGKFFNKYFYCLWWGLKNLSSLGQNLTTSTNIGEILFAIVIASLGLVLFGLLIGNMQTYLQSTTVRLEEWRLRRTDTEQWMHHRQLPQELRQSVRKYDQYKWVATRGVDEEALVKGLPLDLRRDIKRHLCYDLVRRVPLFDQMDARMLDAICERLKPALCTQGTCLMREGDPVSEMLFIIRGNLDSHTTNGGRTGFFNSCRIGPGDFCGEELLTWALDPRPSVILASSTRTVAAVSEVEAFALQAEDLKFVAAQFRRLHSKQLRHKFRFYSHQWRAWAACFVQAAWRRYKKRKNAAELVAAECPGVEGGGLEENVVEKNGPGAGVYAAKLAASRRSVVVVCGDSEGSAGKALQKPTEPDFSVVEDEYSGDFEK